MAPTVMKALLVRLDALPGKEKELASFLEGARAIVMDEPGTTVWFAIQTGTSTFGVFDVFPNDEARDAHIASGVGQALGPNTGVLFSEPTVEKIDILADKLPGIGVAQRVGAFARERFALTDRSHGGRPDITGLIPSGRPSGSSVTIRGPSVEDAGLSVV